MAATQLNFSLRTSSNCKTVHLIGSWDNYNGQLPLSKDSSKAGAWKGVFRFQGATIKQGQRYWYYYIIDGYHVSHDPARESVIEPTTGRKLNTLDIPITKSAPSAKAADASSTRASRSSRRVSTSNVAKGRALSPSRIAHPLPQKPHATRKIRQEQFSLPTVELLAAKFAAASVNDDSDDDTDSDDGSDVPSLDSRSSNNSTPSSVSSVSSCCTCERYGITRAGSRVKLDCGGSRCSYSDESECSSDSEDEVKHIHHSTRRQGLVVRK